MLNGHSYDELLAALNTLTGNGKPTVIIANTIKGNVYMEDVTRWHNTMPNKEEIEIARKDLETNCIEI